MSISRSEILRKKKKQEHKVSYRCSLPSPLQKRSKDSKELHCRFASFELLSFLWLWKEVSQKAEKLLAKVKEKENSEARVVEPTFFAWFEPKHLQNLNANLRNPWISSAMAMAMSIYRTLCVLVFFLKISLLEMLIAFGNEHCVWWFKNLYWGQLFNLFPLKSCS